MLASAEGQQQALRFEGTAKRLTLAAQLQSKKDKWQTCRLGVFLNGDTKSTVRAENYR